MDEAAQHFQNEYYGQTTVHPIGLGVLLVLGIATVLLRRRWALVPALILICFVPMAQRIVIAGFDFTFLRLLILFGWCRVLVMCEYRHFLWRPLDKAVIIWAVATVLFGTRTSGGDTGALIKYLGHTYDALGSYFLFRCLVRGWDDLITVSRALIVLSIPVSLAFFFEHRTGRNIFSVFGGVPEITNIRDGRLRCQGAFSHPILAGCFWATTLPLMAAQAWHKWRVGAVVGLVAGVAIVGLCASSTPVFALIAGTIGAVVALFGDQTRKWIVRFSIVGAILLHVVMNAPVWHLLTRVSVVGGSSGHHRYRLIDAAIEHYDEWWLMGSTVGTDHWGRGLFDVTNYYLAQCMRGGLPLLFLFTFLLWTAFSAAARSRRRVKGYYGEAILAAALSITLFQHVASFIGVTYFGQIFLLWYLLLAIVGSIDAYTYREARLAALADLVDDEEETLQDEEDLLGGLDPANDERDRPNAPAYGFRKDEPDPPATGPMGDPCISPA